MSDSLLFWLQPELVAASLRASASWWRDADVPDPLNYVDFKRRPDLLSEAIERRVGAGRVFGLPHGMGFPKPSGGMRVMTCVDPIGEIGYRLLVGRVVDRIAAGLPVFVFSTRPQLTADSWKSEGWRAARRRFTARDEAERASGSWKGRGHLDVLNHYATVDVGALARELFSRGCSPPAIKDLVNALRYLAEFPGQAGLPIGPEGSAPLGTLALVHLDRRLAREGIVILRWVDDVSLFVRGEEEYLALKDAAAAQLELNHQQLNPAKCSYESLIGGSDDRIELHSLVDGGNALVESPDVELAFRGEWQIRQGITAALGQLRVRRNPAGIQILRANPWIVLTYPRQSTLYLWDVRDSITDWDWITSVLFQETLDQNAAAQLRLARLLRTPEITQEVGAHLFEKGCSLNRSRHGPLANELLAAAGRSQERSSIRRNRALELALELGDVNARRALLSPFFEGPPSRATKTGLRHLAHRDADLAAATELALAA